MELEERIPLIKLKWIATLTIEEFEKKLQFKFTTEQRRTIMSLFQFGMFLALIENQSGLNVQGSYHPTILNCLASPRQIIQNLNKHKLEIDLEFAPNNDKQMEIVYLAVNVGYFHSKYTPESPQSLMEFVRV